MPSQTTIQRNSEIIQTLCQNTLTTEQLLSALQTAYPLVDWTQEMLAAYLVQGKREGRYCQVRSDPDTWQIRNDMVTVGPSNAVYQTLCSSIHRRFACTSGTVSSVNGVNLPTDCS